MTELDIHDEQGRYEKEIEQINKCKNSEVIQEWLREKKLKNKCKVSTLGRALRYYKKFDEWFDKDFRKVTQKDIEQVIMNLQENKYKKIIGKGKKVDYEKRGIANIKSEMKSFFLWIIKKYKLNLDLEFIDTTKKDEEISVIDMSEIQKLIDQAGSLWWKAGIRILSDGGLRIEEFLNTRWGDYTFDKELNCYMVRIRISKTKPRTISLPLSTKEIEDYKDYIGKVKPEDYFFPLSYSSVKSFLESHGKKVLGKHIHAHLLRHVSATFYANKLNHYQMCKRYGWSFNSPMPQKYIDRNGIGEKETAKIIRSDEVGELKLKLSRQEIDHSIYKETRDKEIEEMKKKEEDVVKKMENLANMLLAQQKNIELLKESMKNNPEAKKKKIPFYYEVK